LVWGVSASLYTCRAAGAFKGWWAVPTLQMYKVELSLYN
jgi:hypothetical protein